ncbi:MAG: bifunctional oligoribonuclease/PAP phosphatase NrnA [Anaerohalosphaeraceae bacterium]|nr:bifunctional oligoribonuclease/PAP phosphatase NrnA [Anaerohalosphaeraceae bacterium]
MVITGDFKKTAKLIKKSTSCLVTSHTRPDGDAVGSMKAMCQTIEALGKKAQPLLLSPLADWYSFLFSSPVPVFGNDITLEQLAEGSFGQFDLVIIVDTNSYVQLPEFDKWLKDTHLPILVIDHHITGDGFGTVELIDSTAAATGEIVYDLLKYAKWPVTEDIAEALFVALSTDTGWFRFENSDARVFRNASALIECGAKPAEIYRRMYQNYTPARFQLLGRMIKSLEFDSDGQIALQHLTRADFDQTGAVGRDTEEFVNECQRIRSVRAVALFVELADDNWRCSLRSDGSVDVREIAQKFGGGGHKMAAGVNMPGPFADARGKIVAEFRTRL